MADFFGKLKSGAEKVAFEAEKMNRLNRARGELEKQKSQIQAQYAKLGEMYFTERETAGVTGPAFDELCEAITSLQQQVEAKDLEVQRIDAEVYAPQSAAQPVSAPSQAPSTQVFSQSVPPAAPPAPAAATKFCPNCGKELPVAIKFCTDCGTKV